MKYRVIIADDEKKIIELIKQLGHWKELDIEIVDECANGRAAYESICKYKPDFVLSDIKMPVYDGIELIRKLREEGINPFFILLSGYRHFEYARSAIQLNVIDYLLKPIDEQQLNRTLKRACACIEEVRIQKEESNMLSEWKNDRDQQKREGFWKVFTESINSDSGIRWRGKNLWECADFPHDRKECSELFHMDFPYDCFQMLCIFSDLSSILGNVSSAGHKKVEGFIQECMQKKAVTYYHTTYMGYIILLNYKKEMTKEVRQAVCALYYHILDLSELYGEIRLNIGISSGKESLSELTEAFQEAHDSEWGRLVYAGNGILDYEQIDRLPRCNMEDIVSEEETERIRDAVKYLKLEEISGLAQHICKRCGTYNNYSPRAFRTLFFYLENMMAEEFITDQKKRERFQENYYYAYLNAGNYQQAIKGAFLVLMQYMEEEKKQIREKMDKPVSMAVQYIREHYQEQISLEDAAFAGNVSPNYLSKLFRSEMEIGFLDYLTQTRLKESEKLLEETNLSIREIAAKVGYLDEKYYSKLFKKATGIKPSEYRRIYS